MRMTARVGNGRGTHEVVVATGGNSQTLAIGPRPSGQGSVVSGGEFLLLALATCYCNDLYREAARLGLHIDAVEVEASAEFDGVGLAARDVRYSARIDSPESEGDIERLLRETDAVAEVHNTLRAGASVMREPWDG